MQFVYFDWFLKRIAQVLIMDCLIAAMENIFSQHGPKFLQSLQLIVAENCDRE